MFSCSYSWFFSCSYSYSCSYSCSCSYICFYSSSITTPQRLAVQMLCYQLDNTWQYFTRTFKMQVNKGGGRKTGGRRKAGGRRRGNGGEKSRRSRWGKIKRKVKVKKLFQDHLYVQYVELNQFQNEFRELSNKFQENEKIIQVRRPRMQRTNWSINLGSR